MSDGASKGTGEQGGGMPDDSKRVYEPPKLVHVGNARDLLAGASGTQPDGAPIGPLVPTRGPS